MPRDPTKKMVSLRLSRAARQCLSEAAELAGKELGTAVNLTQTMEMALREFCDRRRGAPAEETDERTE